MLECRFSDYAKLRGRAEYCLTKRCVVYLQLLFMPLDTQVDSWEIGQDLIDLRRIHHHQHQGQRLFLKHQGAIGCSNILLWKQLPRELNWSEYAAVTLEWMLTLAQCLGASSDPCLSGGRSVESLPDAFFGPPQGQP